MKGRQLSDIDIEEISLVDLPAIRKKFVIVKNEDGKSFDDVSFDKFSGSPRNPFGTHCSYRFKGGADGYRRAWEVHFSQINGGALTAAASGPIRGTVRRVAMIAAGMKPACNVVESESVSARGGAKSPLSGDFPEKPSDYGLSSWLKPGDENVDRDTAMTFTCNDLNIIKRAASAEIKRRIKDREAMEKGLTEEEIIEKIMKQEEQDDFHNNNKIEVKKMEKLIEIFKEINDLEEVSDEQMEVFKALSEEDIKKYSEALEVVKKYKDELPEDLNKELSNLAKFGVRKMAKPKEKEEEDLEKSGRKLSKDTLNIIEGAIKQLGSLSEALTKLLPTEDTEKMAEEKKKAEEVSTKIDEAVKKAKEETDKVLAEKDSTIEELKKRVDTLEETKNGKKSLEEETPDKDTNVKKDGTFQWKFIEKM